MCVCSKRWHTRSLPVPLSTRLRLLVSLVLRWLPSSSKLHVQSVRLPLSAILKRSPKSSSAHLVQVLVSAIFSKLSARWLWCTMVWVQWATSSSYPSVCCPISFSLRTLNRHDSPTSSIRMFLKSSWLMWKTKICPSLGTFKSKIIMLVMASPQEIPTMLGLLKSMRTSHQLKRARHVVSRILMQVLIRVTSKHTKMSTRFLWLKRPGFSISVIRERPPCADLLAWHRATSWKTSACPDIRAIWIWGRRATRVIRENLALGTR